MEETIKPILQANKLVKRYGRVTAMDNADFELYPGEILAVIGDNGAGKSTMVKSLCGAVVPDDGKILLDGQPVHFTTPIDARDQGIEIVYQNLALSPALSIADNLFLGRELRLSPAACHRNTVTPGRRFIITPLQMGRDVSPSRQTTDSERKTAQDRWNLVRDRRQTETPAAGMVTTTREVS